MLERERDVYDAHLPEWLEQYAGRFVLVKEDRLVGVYNTDTEALADGARQFGLSSFLVRRVEQRPQEITIPALSLGLLNAGNQHSAPGRGTGR